jgi:predicted ATPase
VRHRCWEQSKTGQGQVVLISGEVGIGKSALVETLRAHVRREGLTRVAMRCSPYHTNSALYPVIAHVQQAIRLARDDTAEEKLTKLERALQPMRLPLHGVLPLLAALLAAVYDWFTEEFDTVDLQEAKALLNTLA